MMQYYLLVPWICYLPPHNIICLHACIIYSPILHKTPVKNGDTSLCSVAGLPPFRPHFRDEIWNPFVCFFFLSLFSSIISRIRNADVPRALVRDMYTKSWSAFDRLVAIVPPGGSIGWGSFTSFLTYAPISNLNLFRLWSTFQSSFSGNRWRTRFFFFYKFNWYPSLTMFFFSGSTTSCLAFGIYRLIAILIPMWKGYTDSKLESKSTNLGICERIRDVYLRVKFSHFVLNGRICSQQEH